MAYTPACATCGRSFDHDALACDCGGEIVFSYDAPPVPELSEQSMWRYASRLPVRDPGARVSLGEGGTPLLGTERLVPGHTVLLKDETRNPSGSMKDRAMSVAFTKARELGKHVGIILSAGGSGIAASFYAARAGLPNFVVVPSDVPAPRLLLSFLAGSIIVRVDGSVEDALAVVDQARRSGMFYEVSTYRKGNPFQAEAQKTIAYEVAETLGNAPEVMVVPVGGGGTLAAIHRGFVDLYQAGRASRVPRMIGVQNANFAALRTALDEGAYSEPALMQIADRIDSTVPTETGGLRHAYPPDAVACLQAIRASGGDVVTVSDAEAVAWQARLSHGEGILAEPSATTALAAVHRLADRGVLSPSTSVVAVITGAGWRDLGRISERTAVAVQEVRADPVEAVKRLGDLAHALALGEGKTTQARGALPDG